MAFPTSDMSGYKKLHERVETIFGYCQESQSVDFKESASWDDLKWKIITTVMAMGNLRDGGIIVIGVSERKTTWDLTGIKEEHLDTFDTDDITDQVNKYSSPPCQLEIVLLSYNKTSFLVIQVSEFNESPFICKKNSPDMKKAFKRGDVFIRPLGKAETKKVQNSSELADLLELAAEKRARRIIKTSQRIGMVIPSDTDEKSFKEELEGL